ncbi:signal peptidase II [Candidatus Shapirobacteria bacterium]|nr:signal peptidase II [Candidatus Shapirobacteria bacterium]
MNDVIVKNYGVSFGQSFPGIIFISALLLVVLIVMAWRDRKVSLWLVVLGGGLNLIERLFFGYVRDYWKIPGISLYNNINDWLIFGGVAWYILEKLKEKK